MARVLITGGAGFIGSHLADALLEAGDEVRALDSLDRQVHPTGERPGYLHPDVELVVGDVRDSAAVARALDGVEAVCHLAATVGVGQSMYQIDRYVDVNDRGTAVLLQAMSQQPSIRRLVVASSMSVYGEGRYVDRAGRCVDVPPRPVRQLRAGDWDVRGPDGEVLMPVPTPEAKPVALTSVYATTKYAQERLCLSVGDAYGIPTLALRFFNVYGSRQALSNPYTGVLAIFASRILNGRPPVVYEDGEQRRDFVSVEDVARACQLALHAPEHRTGVYNIGSGESIAIGALARLLANAMDAPGIEPEVSRRMRAGDIRHCFGDIAAAARDLGFHPRVRLEDGLVDLAAWLRTQHAVDRFGAATDELAARGLTA